VLSIDAILCSCVLVKYQHLIEEFNKKQGDKSHTLPSVAETI
jgi:hypothetical protein